MAWYWLNKLDVTKLTGSALALFMTRVLADHANHILALHDPAIGTKSFY